MIHSLTAQLFTSILKNVGFFFEGLTGKTVNEADDDRSK